MSSSPPEPKAPGARAPMGARRHVVVRALTSAWTRLGVLLTLIGVAVWLSLVSDGFTLAAVRDTVEQLGAWGPLAWVAIYLVATVLLLPGTPFTVGAGLLFGPVVGALAALVGATAGASASFLVGRVIGRDAVAGLAGRRLHAIDRFLGERGFAAVLVVRLVPLFPFNLVNLVSGVTALRVRDYVLGTAIGIVPGTVLLAVSGGAVEDPTSPLFLGSVAGFVGLVVAGGVVARRMRPSDEPTTR